MVVRAAGMAGVTRATAVFDFPCSFFVSCHHLLVVVVDFGAGGHVNNEVQMVDHAEAPLAQQLAVPLGERGVPHTRLPKRVQLDELLLRAADGRSEAEQQGPQGAQRRHRPAQRVARERDGERLKATTGDN